MVKQSIVLAAIVIGALSVIAIGSGIIPIQINDENKILEIEQQVHYYTNLEREKHGLLPLSYNNELSTIAKLHSKDMLQRDFFGHADPSGCEADCRYQRFNYSCDSPTGVIAGENLHWWQYSDNIFWQSAEQIGRETVSSWMESPSHRENILSPLYRNEGIGVVITLQESFITQNFC